MNFFKQELMRIFGENSQLHCVNYYGRTLMGKIDSGLIVKIQFVTTEVAECYSALLVKIINLGGLVDSLLFRFSDMDILEDKPETEVYIRQDGGDSYWHRGRYSMYQLSDSDYKKIADAVNSYIALYQA